MNCPKCGGRKTTSDRELALDLYACPPSMAPTQADKFNAEFNFLLLVNRNVAEIQFHDGSTLQSGAW